MPIGATCDVTGDICKADGTAIGGAQVTATIKSTQKDQGGQVVVAAGVSSEPVEAFTEDDGSFSIQLLQGATVVLEIPVINLRKEVVVPEESTVDFTALI